MATITCVVCGEPGEARICCSDGPVFCDDHAAEHDVRVHPDRKKRSVDEAILEALETEGID